MPDENQFGPQVSLNMQFDGKGGMSMGEPVSMPGAIAVSDAVTQPIIPYDDQAAQPNYANQENVQAPQEQGQGQEVLLAGKFRNQDELIRGYQEAERKLYEQAERLKRANTPPPEPPAIPASPQEMFGPVIGDAIQDNKIDYEGMHDRYLRYGTLEPSDQKRLVEAGIEPQAIIGYLGMRRAEWQQEQMQQAQQQQLTQTDVDAITLKYGGQEGYVNLAKWAGQNLSPEEVATFNRVSQSGNLAAIDVALSGVKQRYDQAMAQQQQQGQAQMGTENRMLGGRSPGAANDGAFTSVQEAWMAMQDPRYNSDLEYTNKINSRFQGKMSTKKFQGPAPFTMG